jgi:hypothetical protein
VDPVTDPLLLRKSCSAGNRTRTSGLAARNQGIVALSIVWESMSKETFRPEKDYLKVEFLSIYLILPAALGPGVYSASNRNKYQR